MKLTIPNVTRRTLKSGAVIYRWGRAPGLRKAGIRAFDLYASGQPFTRQDMESVGLMADPPETATGAPRLFKGSAARGDRLMTAEQASDMARTLNAIARAAPATTPAAPRHAAPRTVEALFRAFQHSARSGAKHGSAHAPDIKPDTLTSYASWSSHVLTVFGDLHPASITKSNIIDFYNTIKATHGERMAFGGVQLLRRLIYWAPPDLYGPLTWQPARLPTPGPKVRVATDEEIAALLDAMQAPHALAARLGNRLPVGYKIPPARPQVADAMMIALWTTMRQRDVCQLTPAEVQNGRVRTILSKSERARDNRRKAVKIDIPQVGPLRPIIARLLAAHADMREHTIPTLIMSTDQHGRPTTLKQASLQNWFREARQLAAFSEPSLLGGRDKYGHALEVFTFEDCRDTAFTRLLLAGNSLAQIASFTGHSLEGIYKIAKHYADLNPSFANVAGAALEKYAADNGIAA